jgi:Putative prokaryotic signal transducing protein
VICATASRPGASRTISEQEPVELTTVPTEIEAAEICGLLGTEGIEATYEAGSGAGWLAGVNAMPHRVFVHASDLERARQLLEAIGTE